MKLKQQSKFEVLQTIFSENERIIMDLKVRMEYLTKERGQMAAKQLVDPTYPKHYMKQADDAIAETERALTEYKQRNFIVFELASELEDESAKVLSNEELDFNL